MFRHGDTDFIGRFEHHAVQTVFHSQVFPKPDSDIGTSLFDAVDSIFRKSDFFGRTGMFDRDQCGENLSDTGRILCDIHVFGIQESPAVQIHDNGRFCPDGRSLWPVGSVVGLDWLKVGIRFDSFRFRRFAFGLTFCRFFGVCGWISRVLRNRGICCRLLNSNFCSINRRRRQTGQAQQNRRREREKAMTVSSIVHKKLL